MGDHIYARMIHGSKILRNFDHHAIYLGKGEEVLNVISEVFLSKTFPNGGYELPASQFFKVNSTKECVIQYDGKAVVLDTYDTFCNAHGTVHYVKYDKEIRPNRSGQCRNGEIG